jgi:hypothetical protein
LRIRALTGQLAALGISILLPPKLTALRAVAPRDLGGLTTAEAGRAVADIDAAAAVVALTIAEFIPRQVMHLQQILAGFPLLGPRA